MKTGLAGAVVAGVLLAALGAGTAHAADPQVVREYSAQVALDIDAQGQVATVEVPADVPAVLVGAAQEAMKHWRFMAPVRDGRHVTARTYAAVKLQLVQQSAGTYQLRAVFGSNGPRLTFARGPEYPRQEVRQGGQGSLTMEAVVHPDGTLTDLSLARYRFNHPGPGAFRKSAEEALSHCHADPELVDGKPVATRVQVPFTYALESITRAEALSRMADRKAGRAATYPASTPSPIGPAVALDSPIQLVSGGGPLR